MEKQFSTEWLGRTLTIKTGKLALQANAAVTVQYGETLVMATVVEAKEERSGIDFFPLMVDFEERLYAAGIIKGSRWVKREGRPTEESILTGRMIDRSIRPLFNESSRKDVQVIITVMSVDQENDFDIVSLVAASAALSISGLKWNGPIGGIRIGRVAGQLVFNPTYLERAESDLDLIVAGTTERVLMIEAGCNEINETEMFAAILAGQKNLAPVMDLIKELQAGVEITTRPAKKKLQSEGEIEEEKEFNKVMEMGKAWLDQNATAILFNQVYNTKGQRKAAVEELKTQLDSYLFENQIGKDRRHKAISFLMKEVVDAEVTKAILTSERRVDGRKLDQIRPLAAEVSLLPRTHGTGLFSRGETQVLSVVTLGAPGDEQSLEGVEGQGTKRFMHHYNFPPYSVGETKNVGSPSRRDIGHGALAEKAILPMLPPKEEFPYTIRVVSETLGSNGSSSMASTCGTSLALMDAGVPLKKAVAGIAIGIASDPEMKEWKILTDIQDLEDGNGGMDFKVAGTRDGITAIQLDTKTIGLTKDMVEEALKRGLTARLEILSVMDSAIAAPKSDLSPWAPRITSFYINPDKIREVIGPGGKMINEIIAATGVSIDIEDDGLVMICGNDAAKSKEAIDWVKSIVREFEAGEIFDGKVVRILDFGAFVELTPGNDGMVHVSQLAPYRIGTPADFLNVGDIVKVKIKEIDEKGRVNLTMLGLPENELLWKDKKGEAKGDFGGGRPMGGGRPGGFGGGRPGGFERRPRRD